MKNKMAVFQKPDGKFAVVHVVWEGNYNPDAETEQEYYARVVAGLASDDWQKVGDFTRDELPDLSMLDYWERDNGALIVSASAALDCAFADLRAERDRRLKDTSIMDRLDRYRNQRDGGIETADTVEWYQAALLYLQALRDMPENTTDPATPHGRCLRRRALGREQGRAWINSKP
jgi:hypothetical protein